MGVLIVMLTSTLQQALLGGFFGLFLLLFPPGSTLPIESMPSSLQVGAEVSRSRQYVENRERPVLERSRDCGTLA